jgi:hypothetical protein
MSSFFLRQSSKVGNSILDWLRSIYFSLSGSSVLYFALKISTFTTYTFIFYGIGNFLFLSGLFFSVIVTKRFKDYEKSWTDEANPEDVSLITYYQDRDQKESWQHMLLYTLWLPAIVSIGIAGFITEMQISEKNQEKQEQINLIERKLESLENIDNELKEIKKSTDSFSNKISILSVQTPENFESNKAQPLKNKTNK